MYKRPTVCRLCERPVADTGVPLAKLDLYKLSKWWLQELETEFNDDDNELRTGWICQFCLWDARFKNERDGAKSDYDWWKGHDQNCFYKKFYYSDEVIYPCAVQIISLEAKINKEKWGSDIRDTNLSQKINKSIFKRINKCGKPGKTTLCVYCENIFKSRAEALFHIRNCHKDVVKFMCPHCLQYFKSKSDRDAHARKFHEKQFRCHFCHKLFTSGDLAKHFEVSSSQCSLDKCCGIVFQKKEMLLNHMVSKFSHKSRPVKCPYCAIIVNAWCLQYHISKWHKAVAVKCPYRKCVSKYFLTNDDMQQHVVNVHEYIKGMVKCIYCSLRYRRNKISKHIHAVHKFKVIKCTVPQCLTYFHSEEERDQHIAEVHFTKSKIASCSICSTPFRHKFSVRRHYQKFHDQQIFTCNVWLCYKYFSSLLELKDHEDTHYDKLEKIYHCDICDFKTKTFSSMKPHFLVKHDLGHFKCSKCCKILKSNYALKRHLIYSHLKPRICSDS